MCDERKREEGELTEDQFQGEVLKRLDGADQFQGQVLKRVDGMDRRFDAMDRKLDNLAALQEETALEVAAVKTRLGNVENVVNRIASSKGSRAEHSGTRREREACRAAIDGGEGRGPMNPMPDPKCGLAGCAAAQTARARPRR